MDIEEKMKLITRYPTVEIVVESELKELLEQGYKLNHYIGFEISGYIHIGTGLVSLAKVVDLQKAGINVTIFLADVHSWLNNKLGGDLEIIRRVANTYYIETFRRVIELLNGDPSNVRFVMASEVYEKEREYWYLVLEIARAASISDAKHSLTILGRRMGDAVPMAWLVYPLMQVADVYILNAHIAHGGIDQRKAYMLAREIDHKVKLRKLHVGDREVKPLALFHKLIPALNITGKEGKEELSEIKMSKSLPETAIFLHDKPEEIRQKILKAYCPPRVLENNPVIEITRLIVFREERKEPFIIERPAKYGGTLEVWTFEELEKIYSEGKLHPLDLKEALIREFTKFIEPLTKWYSSGYGARLLEEMNHLVKITR